MPNDEPAESGDWNGTARYELMGRLGKGGMGVVYEAFDRELRRTVALKTLLHHDPAALYLFKQEFRTLADLRHTNLVHLHELVVPEAGRAFFTMELVRGMDFAAFVAIPGSRVVSASPQATAIVSARPGRDERETQPPTPPAGDVQPMPRPSPADIGRLRAALRQLVVGVHALHRAGKLHRDLKPSNVLVADDGRVVVLDFGVAIELKSSPNEVPAGSGEVVGTVRYMAPEQADEVPAAPASDWYSVGVMLYEALVGRPPFSGSAIDVLVMKSQIDPLPPSACVEGVPEDLDALCRRLLNRDPELRPTGDEILSSLGVTPSRTSRPLPVVDTAATALVGRETQLQALRDAFAATRSGRVVTVRVAGASGMGKSTVVHHALDELAKEEGALVLRGRAYERESVPYKAIDSVIDALSRHLVQRADASDALVMPGDMGALSRLFPVLERVPGVGPAADSVVADEPQSLRRLAFAALRELLATLAGRQPLVVFIDDAQWGDVDSVSLLLELLRPVGPLPMLLVMTCRDGEALESPFLMELRDRWPEGAEMRDVRVGPLDLEDARRLALSLLGASDDLATRAARACARESGGSPFLVEELVRGHLGMVARADGPTLKAITLDRLVSDRLASLADGARRLIEIVAVGGRPLPVSVLASASRLFGSVDEAIALASSRRFTRTGMRNGHEVVETAHDRIRETIVRQLSAETLRQHHGQLARVLEEAPGVDAEAVASHWFGAGDHARAARFARVAAEEASAKLAFEQAARLFRFTLEIQPDSAPDRPSVQLRLAQVLELAGRSMESSRAYLASVEGASPTEQVEYRRAAADQLLAAGRIDEGAEILRGVLAAVRMTAPRSPAVALFWLLVYRVWIAAFGLRIRERTADAVRSEDRLRVDALYTVSAGFGTVDIILGACMQARHFIEAIRRGDRFQVLRAMSLEVAQLQSAGKPATKREEALVEAGRRLVEREKTDDARALFEGMLGIGHFMRGQWREARAALQGPTGLTLRGSNAARQRLFLARSYFFLGDPVECAQREDRLYAEAEDRGDLYTTVNIRTSTSVRKWLAADEPDRARRDVREALAHWPQAGFLVQHWQAMIYAPDIDLYVDDPAAAYERFVRDMPRLKKSLLLHAGFARALTFYTHGRLAIASVDAVPAIRRARIDEARHMARRLDRECSAWTGVLASLVEALAENAEGHRAAAIEALRKAVERAHATETLSYVPAARYRLGQLLGGDEGGEMIRVSRETMIAWGVRNPERWVRVYMPGPWGDARGVEGAPTTPM